MCPVLIHPYLPPRSKARSYVSFLMHLSKPKSAIAYLKVTSTDGKTELGFVLGKARLAPQPELTVPRLELCAVVMAIPAMGGVHKA